MESVKQVFAMTQGAGETSYRQNSTFQADLNKVRQSVLTESLDSVTLPSEDSRAFVVVVDLGSSSSPNSVNTVAQIISNLGLRLPEDTEFQAYFNDLPSNDFNHLFQLLSVEDGAKRFYAAGVPGSFYDRLLPQSHVHVFHSSLCLHWLSKVPDAVYDKNSPAYNGGDIWYMNSRPAVVKAYKEQSMLDLEAFLSAREAELQPGGLLFVTFLGRRSSAELQRSDNDAYSRYLEDVNSISNDLIGEGLMFREPRDSFNFPYYLRSLEEVKGVLESFGNAFRVLLVKMEDVSRSPTEMFPEVPAEELGAKVLLMCKATSQALLETYLTEDVRGIFWQRLQRKFEKLFIADRYFKRGSTMCTISLVRK